MKDIYKMEVFTYSGSLKPKEVIDWVGELEKYSDMEHIEDPKRVNIACLNLKGNMLFCWDNVQDDKV